VSGAQSGDVEFRLTVTHLPDLPPFDFSQLTLDRLTASEENPQAAGLTREDATAIFRSHLKRQVLDRLHATYSFPLLPAIVEREFAGLWKTVEAQLGTVDAQERASLAAEFRAIAERRVRLGLVVAEMARRQGIHVHQSAALEDAVIDHFVAQAQVSERSATVEELRELMEG
jgi:FKBP-type peptidyl-prolyl cis-trans isomerase (trigger factor)